MNKSPESTVSCSDYSIKPSIPTLMRKANLGPCFSHHNEIAAFISSLRELISNGELENLLNFVDFSIPHILESNPKILFWMYKCSFLVLKKKNQVDKANEIFTKFLFPSYEKSGKFKNKITTFSVILHSKNVNMKEITQKIDKYSDKFLNLLQEVLVQQLKFNRENFCKGVQQGPANYKNPKTYCENKHRQILNQLDISQDDSCLSDLEDEILKTCQSGTGQDFIKSSLLGGTAKQNDVFQIKKEPKQKQISLGEKTTTDLLFKQNNNYEGSFINEINDKLSMDVEVEVEGEQEQKMVKNEAPAQEKEQDYRMKIEINEIKQISEIYQKNKANEMIPQQGNLNMHQFAKFVEEAQESKIYQPLRNIQATTGVDTWHNSRKSSENFMDVDEDLIDLIDEDSNYSLNTYNSQNTSNYKIYSNNYNNVSSNSTAAFPITARRKLTHPQDNCFKIPKSNKINPVLESCSNLNYYNKPFIPKAKAKEKLKNLVPFLKDFKPRFLKKENIDKKILRKFRNYVKIIYKNDQELLDALDRTFWKNFTVSNLLPPMKYKEDSLKVEFKSFNTKYLLWLFSKEGCAKLYQDFSSKFGDQILQDFVTAYDLVNNTSEEGIIDKLKHYIHAIPEIYAKRGNNLLDLMNAYSTETCNYTTSNYTYTSKVQSEELLASYLGCEVVYNNGSAFNLNNFALSETAYPRCGKKITERNYYEDCYDNYENYHSFVDTVMNASFDSVPSS